VVAAFADAGIPVQLMGFTGFPGETRTQAETTFNAANILLEKAATVAVGKYGLSSGSLVAKNPAEYGVKILSRSKKSEASIPWDLKWSAVDTYEALPVDDYSYSLSIQRGFPFPFLGATSTMHSLLYFERNAKAPFCIPYWSYKRLENSRFRIIPFFRIGTTVDDQGSAFLSGLTGRVLVLSTETANLVDKLFVNGRSPIVKPCDLEDKRTVEFLDFLVEHSLALFLPEDTPWQ
jgi:hypothetical protein